MGQPPIDSPVLTQQLLLTVAEELRLPLLQISRQAEFGQMTGQADLSKIRTSADAALRLLDNYCFGVRLSLDRHNLELEPVSVASVLYDTSQVLGGLAKAYGVALELDIAGRFGPVMTHRRGLQTALTSLGAALIEALPALEGTQLKLHLATHRSRYGIVAGVYIKNDSLSQQALRKGRWLQAQSRQALPEVTPNTGAGVFVADTVLRAMQLHLGASRHHRLYGLGTVLQPSQQVQFAL